jgi:hypothetical protein
MSIFKTEFFFIWVPLVSVIFLLSFFFLFHLLSRAKALFTDFFRVLLELPQSALNHTFMKVGGSLKEGKRLSKKITGDEVSSKHVDSVCFAKTKLDVIGATVAEILFGVLVISFMYSQLNTVADRNLLQMESLGYAEAQEILVKAAVFSLSVNDSNYSELRSEFQEEMSNFSAVLENLSSIPFFALNCTEIADSLLVPLDIPPCSNLVQALQVFNQLLTELAEPETYESFSVTPFISAFRMCLEVITATVMEGIAGQDITFSPKYFYFTLSQVIVLIAIPAAFFHFLIIHSTKTRMHT